MKKEEDYPLEVVLKNPPYLIKPDKPSGHIISRNLNEDTHIVASSPNEEASENSKIEKEDSSIENLGSNSEDVAEADEQGNELDLKETLNDLEPTKKTLDPNGKYVIFDLRYGRLNNHMWSLQRALELSKKIGRTLVLLSNGGCSNYDFEKIFEIIDGYYDVLFTNWIDINKLNGGRPLRYFYQNTNRPARREFCLKASKLEVVNLRKGKNINMHSITVLQTPDIESDTIIAIALPFRWRLPVDAYRVWEHLEFTPQLRKLADDFLELNELPSPDLKTVGVHLRGFEGKCRNKAEYYRQEKIIRNNLFNLSDQDSKILSRNMCNFGYETIQTITKAYYASALTKIIIASDGQDGNLIDELTEVGGIIATTFSKGMPNLTKIVLDMVLLTRSDLFIGVPFSTFAVNVKDYRLSRGKTDNWVGIDKLDVFVKRD